MNRINHVELARILFDRLNEKLCDYLVLVGEDGQGVRTMNENNRAAIDWLHSKIIAARNRGADKSLVSELEYNYSRICKAATSAEGIARLVDLKYKLLLCQSLAIEQLQDEINGLKMAGTCKAA